MVRTDGVRAAVRFAPFGLQGECDAHLSESGNEYCAKVVSENAKFRYSPALWQ
jgi:hypothetical protein